MVYSNLRPCIKTELHPEVFCLTSGCSSVIYIYMGGISQCCIGTMDYCNRLKSEQNSYLCATITTYYI